MSKHKKGHKAAGTTNKTKKSLVKVVVKPDDAGEWIKPNTLDKFYIDDEANFPSIEFEIKTDSPGPYKWLWAMSWDANVSGLRERARGKKVAAFSDKNELTQAGKSWDAKTINKVIGGRLTVTVEVGEEKFRRTVLILGKSPSKEKIDAYVAQKVAAGSNSNARDGEQDRTTAIATMKKLIQQESQYKHFLNLDSEPIVAFDKGYGLTQLTSGDPTYVQIWNWKAHIDEALKRMVGHRASSVKLFNRHADWPHDDEMIEINAISLWNGGHYYVPDLVAKKRVRNPQMICVPHEGNKGYKISTEEVGKKTLQELQADPKRSPSYTGVCYADTIQGL
ncbi:hypothetical protein BCF11_1979 [Collimonas sp. PA-H2]|uniref:hypothetical protein n=1 Tax=Collimonas sp. PA-H2 TaxID=1881062 RepID=UPI000BF920D6|nr:hypothetical protein [Collimonas sp. PA-H2]PFH09582.1 hypothetical protein BCF11_1979 [Collimonas sp. PA-H2]